MKKEELIEKYEKKYETIYGFPVIQLNQILEDLKQLDEPQKLVVPQFVADLIKEAKMSEWDLGYLFDHIDELQGDSEISKWFYKLGNVEVLARAWLDGYEVEKEKRYKVKMKGISEDSDYLNYDSFDGEWYFASDIDGCNVRTHHTRKELEEAGFGWVFDCPGVEVREVEG